MSDATGFGKFVPGFDFLQSLVKNAGSALPGIGQWVAPTLDPAELDKRIGELRTVQYWLEQNARMLAATIQALEVQRMTLSTLKSMNVQMGELGESLKIKPAKAPAAPASDAVDDREAAGGSASGEAGDGAASARRASARGPQGRGKGAGTARGRPDAVVGRAHEPVRRARHQRHEGPRRRRRQDARQRHGQELPRCRERDAAQGRRRTGSRHRRRGERRREAGAARAGEEGGQVAPHRARGRMSEIAES